MSQQADAVGLLRCAEARYSN